MPRIALLGAPGAAAVGVSSRHWSLQHAQAFFYGLLEHDVAARYRRVHRGCCRRQWENIIPYSDKSWYLGQDWCPP